MTADPTITQLLQGWRAGDAAAGEQLAPLVYDELHRLASRLFRGERPGHTLQPTALVNEAYARLVAVDVDWRDRAHFYALAARMMRRLLVNHAAARETGKRGGGALRITLDESASVGVDRDAELLSLDRALSELGKLDPRRLEIVELHYFGGLTFAEMEQVTGLSTSTLERDLRLARAWLKDRLSG
jgi:RNA polymerase sigma factor (TIGR02999 family)